MLVKAILACGVIAIASALSIEPFDPAERCPPCNIECGDHPVNRIRTDDKGCPICECECPQVDCPICPNDEFEFPIDEFGCGFCTCKHEPTPPPTPACPVLFCFIPCLDGSFPDERGCDTCDCKPPPSVCNKPIVTGPCEAFFPSWGFDSKKGKCVRFIYGGCRGNENRFTTQERCEQVCPARVSTTTTTVAPTKSTEKPGECPAPSGLPGICIFDPKVNCLGDEFCPGDKKCCSEGCGSVCKSPIKVPKPGRCPAPSGLVGICLFDPRVNCLSDDFCPGDKKCCSEGCGSICKSPLPDES